MKASISQFVAMLIVSLGLACTAIPAQAQSQSFRTLTGEWWQWVLSIPVPDNPLLDATGEKCMVGQHGSIWFLVGSFGGGTTTRTCSVPQGKSLFFPLINSVNIDTPNVCGSGPERIAVEQLRAASEEFINGATNLSVELDGRPLRFHRVRSKVFEVALPEENLFDAPCAQVGGAPAGIYSPAVDAGFYVKLRPLEVGNHTLHFHAERPNPENPDQGFVIDVVYNLDVVPVVRGEHEDQGKAQDE